MYINLDITESLPLRPYFIKNREFPCHDDCPGLVLPPLKLGPRDTFPTRASRMLPVSSIYANEGTIDALSLALRRLPFSLLRAVSPESNDAFSSANGFSVSANGSEAVRV